MDSTLNTTFKIGDSQFLFNNKSLKTVACFATKNDYFFHHQFLLLTLLTDHSTPEWFAINNTSAIAIKHGICTDDKLTDVTYGFHKKTINGINVIGKEKKKYCGIDEPFPTLHFEEHKGSLPYPYLGKEPAINILHDLRHLRFAFGLDLQSVKEKGFEIKLDKNALMSVTKGLKALKNLSLIDGLAVVDVSIMNIETQNTVLVLSYQSDSCNQQIHIPIKVNPNQGDYPQTQYFEIKRLLFIFDVLLRMKPVNSVSMWIDSTYTDSPIAIKFKSTYGDIVNLIVKPLA